MAAPQLRSVEDADVSGKRVLVRADLNVPLTPKGDVADDFRIRAFLPTLELLLDRDARVLICSHLGRPKGEPDDRYRLEPVARRLGELAGREITPVPQVVGPEVTAAVDDLQPGTACLLENLRFHPGETANNEDFADELAELAEVYVNDAFGACHRAHASIVGVAKRLPSYAGLLLTEEVANLSRLLGKPEQPFVVLLGGVKVADKIGVVRRLLDVADRILIGGGMCFTFLRAQGSEVGRSLVDEDRLGEVEGLLSGQAARKLVLPTDVIAAASIDDDTGQRVASERIPADLLGADIGPESARGFASHVLGAKTVFWNGPMGVFENEAFSHGTKMVAEAVAETEAYTVTGGGDTAAALAAFDLDDAVDFLSTGGGASLELLEGKTLPGIAALREQGDTA